MVPICGKVRANRDQYWSDISNFDQSICAKRCTLYTVGMRGMKVKRQNILAHFLSHAASAKESLKNYRYVRRS